MILFWMVAVLVGGGALAWVSGRIDARWPRRIAAASLAADLAMAAFIGIRDSGRLSLLAAPLWTVELQWNWIPGFGASFHLALDGVSFLLVALTLFLGLVAVVASWSESRTRPGFFHFNLLWALAGIVGVFLAVDLFLFYFFWELMLVPMYFLIGIWGHERRIHAAFKFFLFTQAGGLAMLLSILALYFVHGRAAGSYTFDYAALLGTQLGASAPWIMMGFLAAFIVKAAGIPVHTWLPDAHAQAPTAGSVILAGLLLKTGAYGLIRFVLPLFPEAARSFAPYGMAIGVAGILYGAKLAFAQSDLKRMVAYTSVSHMGFVLLGIFSLGRLALQGAVLQMLCHGISTGALFILAGAIQERLGTRDLGRMGGFWERAPRMGVAGLVFALASLGLPGLGNFVAEFLVLAGTFRRAPVFAVLASLGLIASTIYALRLFQAIFHGPRSEARSLSDLGVREAVVLAVLAAVLFGLGFYPQPALNVSRASVEGIESLVTTAPRELGRRIGPSSRLGGLPAGVGAGPETAGERKRGAT